MAVQRSDLGWLAHCEGFGVEASGRRLGVVEEVLFVSGRPAAIIVVGGVLRVRTLLVDADEVEGVWPTSRRVVLSSTAPKQRRRRARGIRRRGSTA